MQAGQHLLAIVVGAFIGAVMLSLYSRRESIAVTIWYWIQILTLYVLTFFLAIRVTDKNTALLVAIIVGLVAGNLLRPRRQSRYISRRARRIAIARFERRGERYDSKKHDIDHVVPHSRGGTSRADNLRVADRRLNRSKGAKSPWWDVLGK